MGKRIHREIGHRRRSCGLAGPGTDAGFTLIEMVLALGLLAVVLPVFASMFIGSNFAAADARLKEVATTVADTALDQARAVTPPGALLSDGPSAGTAPTGVSFANTVNPVVLSPLTTKVDNRVFTAQLYAGSCYLQSSGSSGGQCTTTPSSAPMVRVITDVTWSAPNCGTTGCYYVASTLLSSGADTELNINPEAAPATPSGLAATPGNQKVVVSWNAVSSTTYPVTGYTVSYSGGNSSGTCIPAPSPSGTACTISGLTNGTSYSFTVTATSAGGTSPASAAVAATPADPPPTPSNLAAAAGKGQVALTWYEAASDYNPVTYTVSATNVSTGGSAGSCTYSSPTTPDSSAGCTVTGLTNGTAYSFTVTAASTGGGTSTSASVTATPTDPPPTPTGLTATVGTSSVTLTWAEGGSDYNPVTYTVSATNASTGVSAGSCTANSTTTPDSSTSCTVSGLTNGTAYSFTVYASSSGGSSPRSSPVTATPIGAPTGVSASRSGSSVTVSWTAPPGGPTSYTVTAYKSPSGSQVSQSTGTSTTHTFTGLSTSTSYYFTVVANSSYGSSSPATASPNPISG